MMVHVYSNERWALSRLLSLGEPLGALYGERWIAIRPAWSLLVGAMPPPLPSLRPWEPRLSLQRALVHGSDGSAESLRRVAEQALPYFTRGTSVELYWAPTGVLPLDQHWFVCAAVADNGVVVGVDFDHWRDWPASQMLPAIIDAGALPLSVAMEAGRPVLCHRIDPALLYTPRRDRVDPASWRCLLPGVTVLEAVALAERIVETVARGCVGQSWLLDSPETTEADCPSRLALWERLVELQPPANDYDVTLQFHITDVAVLEALQGLPGRWTIRYWFGSADLRDEQGMPLGFEGDDPVACGINFGVETTPAGHRLVLEADNAFNLTPIMERTGLTFGDWEV